MNSKLSEKNKNINFGVELKEPRLKKVIQILKQNVKENDNFLDIGCSNGNLLEYFQKLGANTFGLDINTKNIQLAKNKLLNVKICDLNQNEIPYDENYFEFIFAGEVIEHLVDTDFFIKQVYRVLKYNGKVILTTPNLNSLENRLRILVGYYPEWVDFSLSEGVGHVRSYNFKKLAYQLEKHNFKVISKTGSSVPYLPRVILKKYNLPEAEILATIFPTLSENIIIVATKL